MNALRPFEVAGGADAARQPIAAAGADNPWRAVAVGGVFCVPQGINYATRTADYYRRKYGLGFACRKAEGRGTIVRRVR